MTSDGRTFSLAPRVLGLGYSFLSGLGFPNVALPYLEQLVAEVDESSEASILDGHDVVYVTRVPGPKLMTIAVNIGSRMPAHATSMGRVLLAGLSDEELESYLASATLTRFQPATMTDSAELRGRVLRARADGYAVVDQELEEGLLAVAVPIHDRFGRTIAAINLSTLVTRHNCQIGSQRPAPAAAALRPDDRARPRERGLVARLADRDGGPVGLGEVRVTPGAAAGQCNRLRLAQQLDAGPGAAPPRPARCSVTPIANSNGPRWPQLPLMSGDGGMCWTGSIPAPCGLVSSIIRWRGGLRGAYHGSIGSKYPSLSNSIPVKPRPRIEVARALDIGRPRRRRG